MCGIFGVLQLDSPTSPSFLAALEVYQGLLALQHRGQDAAGILSALVSPSQSMSSFFSYRACGLVSEVFTPEILQKLPGSVAIGHTRYATIGSNSVKDLQPLFREEPYPVALVHNGNLVNYHRLAEYLEDLTQNPLETQNDLELFLRLWSLAKDTPPYTSDPFLLAQKALHSIFTQTTGAYSVIGIDGSGALFAFRDPHGIRPLVYGIWQNKGTQECRYAFASETCALEQLGYTPIRSLKPGELIWISPQGHLQELVLFPASSTFCMFEWVYFSKEKSLYHEESVLQKRSQLGKILASKVQKAIEAQKISPEVVVPVPHTSIPAAVALAQSLNLPLKEALASRNLSQRSFILASPEERKKILKQKWIPRPSEIRKKKILLIDDSLVRGSTAYELVSLLRQYQAQEITLALTCPPLRYPCFYGFDFPSSQELLASGKTEEEIAVLLGLDHLIYLEPQDLKTAFQTNALCLSCITGQYPTSVEDGACFASHRRKPPEFSSERFKEG
jgi:amidophosphoribosyltransferase